MKYRKCHREGMVKQFQQVRDHPEVRSYDIKEKNVSYDFYRISIRVTISLAGLLI